jgi:hypothetical protein
MSLPCHFLIQFLTCSPMVTFMFGKLLKNEVGPHPFLYFDVLLNVSKRDIVTCEG